MATKRKYPYPTTDAEAKALCAQVLADSLDRMERENPEIAAKLARARAEWAARQKAAGDADQAA